MNLSPISAFANRFPPEKIELVKTWLETPVPLGKSIFCEPYLHGSCMFGELCRFAHGVHELAIDWETQPQMAEREKVSQENHDFQKSFGCFERRRILYEYQSKLIETGRHPNGTSIYTMEEIDNPKSSLKRNSIRDRFRSEMLSNLYDRVAEYSFQKFGKHPTYNLVHRIYLSTLFVGRFGYLEEDNHVFRTTITNEEKQKETLLIRAPDLQTMENFFVRAFAEAATRQAKSQVQNEESKGGACQILSSSLLREYYTRRNPIDPPLELLLKLKNLKTAEAYVQNLTASTSFHQILSELMGCQLSDPSKIIVNKDLELRKFINEFLDHTLAQNETTFVVTDTSNWLTAFKAYAREKNAECLRPGDGSLEPLINESLKVRNLIRFGGQTYDFIVAYRGQIPSKKWIGKCNDSSKILDTHELQVEKLAHPLQTAEITPYVAGKDFYYVNDIQTAAIAFAHLSGCSTLAYDLEGDLSSSGLLELIQVCGDDKTFIFDIYSMRGPSGSPSLWNLVRRTIKRLLEDPSKISVFHDGRADNVSIHSHFDCCPCRVLDTSAIYRFNFRLAKEIAAKEIKAVEPYCKTHHFDAADLANPENLGRPPGLNVVLRDYQASHGPNEFKDEIKKKFGVAHYQQELFLKRPLDTTYFLYSGRDVEDLAEVSAKMVSETDTLLKLHQNKAGFKIEDVQELLIEISTNFVASCKT